MSKDGPITDGKESNATLTLSAQDTMADEQQMDFCSAC